MIQLYAGAVGWNHDAWEGTFYDEDLPPEWRFQHYANQLRSVLLPSSFLKTVTAEARREWLEECDPDFRFVPCFEPDAETNVQDAEGHISIIDSHMAVLVLHIGEHNVQWYRSYSSQAWLDDLRQRFPICLDVSPGAGNDAEQVESAISAARLQDCSRVWRPWLNQEPEDLGDFLVARLESSELPELRAQLARVVSWMGKARSAAVFLEPGAPGSLLAQFRILGELMDVN